MFDNNTDDNGNDKSDYTLVLIAGAVSAILLSIILFIFASNVDSREMFHGYYLLASFVFVCGFGVATAMKRYGLAVTSFVLMALVVSVSVMKFDERADINALIQSREATILAGYVRTIPPLEKRVLPFFNTPKWVEFDRECFRPALQESPAIAPECSSREAIFNAYKIDVVTLINGYYNRLHNTATRVRNQEFIDRTALQACVNDGFCVPIPLLPSSVEPNSISEVSPEFKEIRQDFWALVDNPTMNVDFCEVMDLCRAMTIAGAVDRRDFQSSL